LVKNSGTDDDIRIYASEFDNEISMAHFFHESKPQSGLLLKGIDYSYFDVITLCNLSFSYLEDLIKEEESFKQ